MRLRIRWPLPVYVARFANGETARASFTSYEGRAVDLAHGRRVACYLWGDMPRVIDWTAPLPPRIPRGDLIAGHVECDGDIIPDTSI